MNRFKVAIALFSLLALFACEREIDETEADEMLRLQAFISLYYSDYSVTPSGVYYKIHTQGDGNSPAADDYVLYNYTGTNLEGDIFETSNSDLAMLHEIWARRTRYVPRFTRFKSTTSVMLAGITDGLSLMKQGGTATFIMPSRLAWGSQSFKNLPAYSSVIYNINLQRVVTNPDAYEQEMIDQFLAAYYHPDPVPDTILMDGVYFLELNEGLGDLYLANQTVDSVNYIGSFTDGWVFDTNIDSVARANFMFDANKDYRPMSIKIGDASYIDGFSIVLKKMRRESFAKVLIPSSKAYGATGAQSIFPYTPLVFEISILNKAQQESKK